MGLRRAGGLAAAAALLGLCGCLYLPSSSDTGRVLVVGIGLVSIHDRTRRAVVATSTQVLGLQVSDRPGLKLGLGYASGVVTTVSDGAEDVRAEVSHWPFGPLKVEVDHARFAGLTNVFALPTTPSPSNLEPP